ncbi:FG-GAP-like repeat-containing protein [Nonomuraea fuscirosea]|uniref:FG-GAP-like repeat-containing protein n=1 Tax=Nonomuraea fuscirosea TaxID=1291556 RepID=UPI00342E6BCF
MAAECAIARYRPNVVVLHIGTNDLANGEQHTSALTRLGTLINNIDDIAPLTTVIVSTLVPSTNQAVDSRIALFNSYLPAAVNTWRAEGKRVRLARVLGLTSADMVDALHPNNNGYRKMADTYHNAINSAMDEGMIKPALLGGDRVCAPEPGNPTPGTPPNGVMEGWHRFDGAGGMIAAGVPGGTREGLRFADIDGDGRDDYLMTDSAGRVSAWGNALPSPRWAEMGEVAAGVSGGTRDGLRFADLNGDGRDDYLMVDPQGGVRAWGNAVPSPRWTEWGQVAAGVPGATREEVRFADIDGDGADDYLLVSPQGQVRAWINNLPSPTWTEWGVVAPGVGASRDEVRFADIDGDSRDDYLVVSDTGRGRAWFNTITRPGVASWSS